MIWDATALQWFYANLTKLYATCTSTRYLHHKPRRKSVAYENIEGAGGKIQNGASTSNHYLATHYRQGSRQTYLQYFYTEQFKPLHCTLHYVQHVEMGRSSRIRVKVNEFLQRYNFNVQSGDTCFESRSDLQLSSGLSWICSVLQRYVLYKRF
jgi:hypothetical protein